MNCIITERDNYEPHHKNVKILGESGKISGIVAWWSDNPIQDAIAEARKYTRGYIGQL